MRVNSASCIIAAPRERVFEAMVDPNAVEQWLPLEGARAKLERFEPRPGGAFVMTLVFADDGATKRKTTRDSDRVEGTLCRGGAAATDPAAIHLRL